MIFVGARDMGLLNTQGIKDIFQPKFLSQLKQESKMSEAKEVKAVSQPKRGTIDHILKKDETARTAAVRLQKQSNELSAKITDLTAQRANVSEDLGKIKRHILSAEINEEAKA